MSEIQIMCPNCGCQEARLTVVKTARKAAASGMLNDASDVDVVSWWLREESPEAVARWSYPKDLHPLFVAWWVSHEGIAATAMSQRRMSAALLALGWNIKRSNHGRMYAPHFLAPV